jgi:hypothetical protein
MANDKDTTFGGAGVANARATVKGFVKRESVRIADLGWERLNANDRNTSQSRGRSDAYA